MFLAFSLPSKLSGIVTTLHKTLSCNFPQGVELQETDVLHDKYVLSKGITKNEQGMPIYDRPNNRQKKRLDSLDTQKFFSFQHSTLSHFWKLKHKKRFSIPGRGLMKDMSSIRGIYKENHINSKQGTNYFHEECGK